MQTVVKQYCLCGPGQSGRGVRMREMSAEEVDENGRDVTDLLPTDAKMVEYMQREQQEGVKRSLVAVTKSEGHKSPEAIMALPPEEWVSVNIEKLTLDGPLMYERLFPRAKDNGMLIKIWRHLHVVDQKDADAIVEKGLAVAVTEVAPPGGGSSTGSVG